MGRSPSTDAAIKAIADEYTREAGVRNLEREIGTVCRKIVGEVAEGRAKGKVSVTGTKARELLGRRRYFAESKRRTEDHGRRDRPAQTRVGGDVLFIEATAMPGSGKLTITGQLGDVMRESAQAASPGYGATSIGLPRACRGLVREARHPRSRPGRGGSQGWPVGRGRDDRGARLARERQAGGFRCGDDRRGC